MVWWCYQEEVKLAAGDGTDLTGSSFQKMIAGSRNISVEVWFKGPNYTTVWRSPP
jgi:hypothetical protein